MFKKTIQAIAERTFVNILRQIAYEAAATTALIIFGNIFKNTIKRVVRSSLHGLASRYHCNGDLWTGHFNYESSIIIFSVKFS